MNGGYADPNVSQEIDRLFKLIKTVKELDDSREFIRMTVERQGSSGVLSSIFGDKAQVLKELPNNGLSETETTKIIKDLTEEGFSAYKGKMAVLMKEKNKAAKKAQMQKEREMQAAVASQEVKASEEVAQTISTTQEVVEQAVDNGSKASTEIPNSAPATEQTVREKYASAFGLEGFSITNK
jgi:phosphoribosylformylglycinamidine (FGAM) synthase-like amidotransferase family enzyme